MKITIVGIVDNMGHLSTILPYHFSYGVDHRVCADIRQQFFRIKCTKDTICQDVFAGKHIIFQDQGAKGYCFSGPIFHTTYISCLILMLFG